MDANEVISNPVTMAQTIAFVHDLGFSLYNSGWFGISITAVAAAIIVWKKEIIARKLREWDSAVWNFGRAVYIYAASHGERKKMRKERREHVYSVFKEKVMEGLDDAVEKKELTQTEANELYGLAASVRVGRQRVFDGLRQAIHKPETVKEAIEERRLNQNRDEQGNIVPAPLPDGGARPSMLSRLLGLKTA